MASRVSSDRATSATDQNSVKDDQLKAYDRASKRQMNDLMADLKLIAKATSKSAQGKYQHLLERLHSPAASFDEPVRLVYLSPRPVPGLDKIADAVGLTYGDILDLDLTAWPEAWQLVRDHLLRPIVAD